MRIRLIVFIGALFAALGIAVRAQAAPNLASQSSSQNGVAVQVTPRLAAGGAWEFDFALNTHSGSLTDDLQKAVVLVADGRSYTPVAWEGNSPTGHHRRGVLRFNAISPEPHALEFKLQRPGEPDARVFRWQTQ